MIACLVILQADSGLAAHRGATVPPRHVPDAEASALYRDGLYEWQTRTPMGLKRAVDDFTQAIVHDQLYAEAYVGLANCYNLLREFSTMPPGEAFPRAKAAAEQAIALDPSLGDAHAALAFDDFYWSRDIVGARREFERAITLEPRNATAHHWYATFLAALGEYPHALAQINIAQALDSESTAILADKGLILVASGRRGEGIGLLERLEQTEPTFYSSHRYLADIYLGEGDNAGFLRELAAAAFARHDDSEAVVAEAGARGLAANGREGMLRAILGAQKELYANGKQSAYALALTYAKLNDIDDATAYLKLSLIGHESEDATLAEDATFKRLRTALRDVALKARPPS
jgi:Tfp pilus assembly protein PilF